MVGKHEHVIGQINKHREGTVEVWDSECVHANFAGVLVKEEVVMQSHFLMLEFFLNIKCVCVTFCTTLCWFKNAWMHRYVCVSLVVVFVVVACVCVSWSMCTF